MTPIKIIFFILASFFGIEDGKIAADKTTVTVCPNNKEIEIVQENLFAFIQSENDSLLVLKEWDKLSHWEDRNTTFSKGLESFSVKNLNLTPEENRMQPHLKLHYSEAKDLQVLEIEYDAENNQFSIENTPEYNINTKEGKLIDNHWVFDGDSTFSFTIEPFLKVPEEYQKFKRPLKELLIEK